MNNLPYWLADIRDDVTVIGEVKPRSPFGWVAPIGRVCMLEALDASPDIDWISIHTNELWQGSLDWLREARRITKKPILAKGFHNTVVDVEDCFAAGADYVLTVGWWPGDERCIQECESVSTLALSQAPKRLWNARNPRTGEGRFQDFAAVLAAYGGNPHGWLCQASCVKSAAGVHPQANAVLIGEALWT